MLPLDAKDCLELPDDLLDFNLDEEIEGHTISKGNSPSSSSSFGYTVTAPPAFSRQPLAGSFPEEEFVEEDLEWLSNKDAFPGVETCFGILSDNPELIMKHHSPISVLENSTSSSNSNTNSNGSNATVASCCDSFKVPTNHPVRPRTNKRRGRRVVAFGEMLSQQILSSNQVNFKNKPESLSSPLQQPRLKIIGSGGSSIGRRCLHCQADKTPQWRAGPMGPKTLCNACGVRYKSGRLLPEYRPANSPTFSTVLHSNSHRKVVEMRKQKQMMTGFGEGNMAG